MPKRLNESIEEVDSTLKEERPNGHDGEKESFTSAKFEVMRGSDTLDRRKLDRAFHPPSANGPGNSQISSPDSPVQYVAAFLAGT